MMISFLEDAHLKVLTWPLPKSAQTSLSGASVNMLLPSMHMPAR